MASTHVYIFIGYAASIVEKITEGVGTTDHNLFRWSITCINVVHISRSHMFEYHVSCRSSIMYHVVPCGKINTYKYLNNLRYLNSRNSENLVIWYNYVINYHSQSLCLQGLHTNNSYTENSYTENSSIFCKYKCE